MRLMVFKLMYRLTNDRKWVIRYVDEMDKQIREDIKEFRNKSNDGLRILHHAEGSNYEGL